VSIAALAGAASASLPGAGGQPVSPSYALGFRFTVRIDAVSDLGSWQSCTGLKVEFKTTDVKRGGDYLTNRRLPDKAVYSKVVLKRAVLGDHSSKIQDWLKASAKDWLAGEITKGSTVWITVYDSNDKPVLEWVLTNARPSAWQGPDLDAKSSSVATETLELEHEGFEVRKPAGPAGGAAGTGAAGHSGDPKGPEISGDDGKVVFPFAPDTLTLEMVGKGMHGVAVGATEMHLSEVPSVKLADLTLFGEKTKANVALLADWAKAQGPVQGPQTQDGQQPTHPGGDDQLPIVTFKWGTQFHFTAQIKRLEGKYTRFKEDGTPIRANVGMTLKVIEDKSPPATPGGSSPAAADDIGAWNPTSGGISGRASHVLTESDTLALLAREHYGSPASWRDIAAANAIDDPLRKQPGRLLFLPAASELTERPRP
jgi:phage tail-like protein